jgi:curved DNA-binding protein CbpA
MSLPDYYEILQVSPRADGETIERVFRLLAKRLHPDNTDTGDADRFAELLEAFRTLSDPEARVPYDVRYQAEKEGRWRIVDVALSGDGNADARVCAAILAIMYQARRQNVDHAGLGNLELERMLGCPEDQIRFQLWYLREKGWIQRLENGKLAITVAGVDRVMEHGGPARDARHILEAGSPSPCDEAGTSASNGDGSGGGERAAASG